MEGWPNNEEELANILNIIIHTKNDNKQRFNIKRIKNCDSKRIMEQYKENFTPGIKKLIRV